MIVIEYGAEGECERGRVFESERDTVSLVSWDC